MVFQRSSGHTPLTISGRWPQIERKNHNLFWKMHWGKHLYMDIIILLPYKRHSWVLKTRLHRESLHPTVTIKKWNTLGNKTKNLIKFSCWPGKTKHKNLNEDAICDIVVFILHWFVANLMEPIFPASCVHWNSCSVLVACGAGFLDLTACPFHNERWGDICFHRQQLSFCKR